MIYYSYSVLYTHEVRSWVYSFVRSAEQFFYIFFWLCNPHWIHRKFNLHFYTSFAKKSRNFYPDVLFWIDTPTCLFAQLSFSFSTVQFLNQIRPIFTLYQIEWFKGSLFQALLLSLEHPIHLKIALKFLEGTLSQCLFALFTQDKIFSAKKQLHEIMSWPDAMQIENHFHLWWLIMLRSNGMVHSFTTKRTFMQIKSLHLVAFRRMQECLPSCLMLHVILQFILHLFSFFTFFQLWKPLQHLPNRRSNWREQR